MSPLKTNRVKEIDSRMFENNNFKLPNIKQTKTTRGKDSKGLSMLPMIFKSPPKEINLQL